MKAKAIISGISIAALLVSCGKKTPVPPVADKEFTSSVDASYALLSITDAEMMPAFMAEDVPFPTFYKQIAGTPGNQSPVQNLQSDDISIGFDNSTCKDGALRFGTVNLSRPVNTALNPNANANSRYYRRFGFAGKLTLHDYKVDGWQLTTVDADNNPTGQPCVILNTVSSENFDPATTNLTWSIKGNFRMQKDDEVIFCRVDLVKTLVNTNDPAVFPRNRTAINWPLAIVAYTGKITGTTNDGVPFAMEIGANNPLIRDFTCAPDQVINVPGNTGVVTENHPEFHPFKNGIASFTTGQLYPRQIYYGSETGVAAQCDNSGSVLIKGISYPVNFRKN